MPRSIAANARSRRLRASGHCLRALLLGSLVSAGAGASWAQGAGDPAAADPGAPPVDVQPIETAPADAPPVDAEPARRAESIEEIRVTARRREEALQETPVSVTAFSATDLEAGDLRRLDEIAELTPNLSFGPALGFANSAAVQIRGVGADDPIATRDPGVAIYLDGVYLARPQGQFLELGDIERIEVLRGPQGTLFGRNAIGGALQVITRKPGDELEGYGALRFGNYGAIESRASINLPLVEEKAALRLSFQSATRDGYSKNLTSGQDADDRKLLGGRVALALRPRDDLEILLSGDRSRTHSAGRGGECRYVPSKVPTSIAIQLENANSDPRTGVPFDFASSCRESQSNGALEFRSPLDSEDQVDSGGLASTISLDIGDTTLKSISAWRRQRNARDTDLSFGRTNVGHFLEHADQQDQISQEFDWSGRSLGGRLAWNAGLFGFHEKTDPGLQEVFAGFNLCSLPPGALQLTPAARAGAHALLRRLGFALPELPADGSGTPELDAILAPAVQLGICNASFQQRASTHTYAYAAYGQLTYDLSDRLHLTAGLRRSAERKEYEQVQQQYASASALDPTRFATRQAERFGKWTPLLNLSYDVGERAMLYATYSRGFKSGGFNGRPTRGLDSTLEPFDQEELDNYEIGLKSSWFERRLLLDVSLFRGYYANIQQTILTQNPDTGAFASRVSNAARAIIQGGELELRALPAPGLDLRVALGFTDARYRQYTDFGEGPLDRTTGLPTSVRIDRSGEDFLATPAFTASLSAGYTFLDLLSLGDFSARLTWLHSSGANYGPTSAFDTLRQGKYGVLNARLALRLRDRRTEIALFADNLLDRRYLNSGLDFEDGFAASVAYYAPPRTYGAEIRRSF